MLRPGLRVPVRVPALPAVLHRAVPADPGSLLAPPVGVRRRPGPSPHGPLGSRAGGFVRRMAPPPARRGRPGPVRLPTPAGQQRLALSTGDGNGAGAPVASAPSCRHTSERNRHEDPPGGG